MTEIEKVEAHEITPVQPTKPGDLGYLQEYAKDLTSAYTVAKTIANTSFTPAHFRGKPEEAATAMLYGGALGLNPIHAVKGIYAVHGTPALYADTMLAVALQAGHQIERVEATEQMVKYRAKRRGSDNWQDVVWTIQRAERAGYTSNKKYQTDPIGMLSAKCKSEAAKLVAADALMGLYSVEDLELEELDTAVAVQPEPVKKPRKTIQRKQVNDEPNSEPGASRAEDTGNVQPDS